MAGRYVGFSGENNWFLRLKIGDTENHLLNHLNHYVIIGPSQLNKYIHSQGLIVIADRLHKAELS